MSSKLSQLVAGLIASAALALPTAAIAEAIYQYEPAVVSLQGKLTLSKGETADGAPTRFPSLVLERPITVEAIEDLPRESNVTKLHLVLGDKNLQRKFKQLQDKPATVKGKLFHSDNGNHMTSVLITVEQISESGP